MLAAATHVPGTSVVRIGDQVDFFNSVGTGSFWIERRPDRTPLLRLHDGTSTVDIELDHRIVTCLAFKVSSTQLNVYYGFFHGIARISYSFMDASISKKTVILGESGQGVPSHILATDQDVEYVAKDGAHIISGRVAL
ncbi:hypothetical protein EB093_04380 [bacterium]|nr:hypothetical protein [bacterium]